MYGQTLALAALSAAGALAAPQMCACPSNNGQLSVSAADVSGSASAYQSAPASTVISTVTEHETKTQTITQMVNSASSSLPVQTVSRCAQLNDETLLICPDHRDGDSDDHIHRDHHSRWPNQHSTGSSRQQRLNPPIPGTILPDSRLWPVWCRCPDWLIWHCRCCPLHWHRCVRRWCLVVRCSPIGLPVQPLDPDWHWPPKRCCAPQLRRSIRQR